MKHVTIIGGSRLYAHIVKKVLRDVCKVVCCSKRMPAAVIFVSDARMRELNRTYRGKNKTTNVLAFPLTPHPTLSLRERVAEGRVRELGDVFISFPEAKREAKKYGWTIRYEIARLTLHGFLHLLGYTHTRMVPVEKKILVQYVEH